MKREKLHEDPQNFRVRYSLRAFAAEPPAARQPAALAKLDAALAASQASSAKVGWHDVATWGVKGRLLA